MDGESDEDNHDEVYRSVSVYGTAALDRPSLLRRISAIPCGAELNQDGCSDSGSDAEACAHEVFARLAMVESADSVASDGSPPSASARSDEPHAGACVACTEHEAKFAMVPCGHVCFCELCDLKHEQHCAIAASAPAAMPVGPASTGTRTARRCPMCRAFVQRSLQIYLQRHH